MVYNAARVVYNKAPVVYNTAPDEPWECYFGCRWPLGVLFWLQKTMGALFWLEKEPARTDIL